jgi:hypothetical protein
MLNFVGAAVMLVWCAPAQSHKADVHSACARSVLVNVLIKFNKSPLVFLSNMYWSIHSI